MKKKEVRPKGLGWRAFIALAGMIGMLFGNGCSRIHGGYVRGTIPSRDDLEKRVQRQVEPLTESERDHFAGLLVGTGINLGICVRNESYLQCRAHLQEPRISPRTRNTLLCTIACGENSPLLTVCINNDVPTAHPEMGTSITCDAAVAATMTDAQLEVTRTRDQVAAATRDLETARNLATTQRLAAEGQRDAERRRAEDAERELAALRAQQAQPTPPPPPTLAYAPEATPRQHRSRRQHLAVVARPRAPRTTRNNHVVDPTPAPAPEFNHGLNGSGMMCTQAVQQRNGTWVTSCETRVSSEASGSLLTRLATVEGMTASRATTGVARIHRPRSPGGTPRIARAVVAQIIADNESASECGSAVILACRPTNWTRGQPYYAQRVGVCDQATNNHDAVPTTLATFTEDATEHCGANANVEVWVLPNRHIRLRFNSEPAMDWQPPPTPAPRATSSLTTHRRATRAIALTTPSLRPNAHRTEVMARTGTPTAGSIARWLNHRWRYWRPSAFA